jgi:tetratricopeptide (TPR) repeat protein
VADFPRQPDYQAALAMSYGRLAALQHASGQLAAAEAGFRDALNIDERLAAAHPQNAGYRAELAETRLNLPGVLVARDPPLPEAAWVVGVVAEALKKHPQAGHLWYRLGVAKYRVGNAAEALAALKKARQLHFEYGREGTFYAAMALWTAGEKESGRKVYDAGVQAMARATSHPSDKERRLRAEAAQLLGIKEVPKPVSNPPPSAREAE